MRMRIKLFLAAASIYAVCTAPLGAKPAQPGIIQLVQPDGTTVSVRLQGDEHLHYMTTSQGAFVVECADGYYRYARWDGDNALVATEYVASDDDTSVDASLPRISDAVVQERLQNLYLAAREQKDKQITVRKAPMRRIAQNSATDVNEVRGIIILAEYQDVKFKPTSTREAIDNLMNEPGNNYMGAYGSARDYFMAQSYGKFQPNFDVVGPVTLDNNASYYGGNDRSGNDLRPEELIIEACQKASAQGLCNMSDYDLDGDGWVDLVYVIYAGYSESSGAPAWTVWPHMWYVYQGAGRSVSVDGVRLDMYACSSELSGTSGSSLDGIGSFCHEYSHTLGLPDIYDTQSYNFGMDIWSIMDYGCYAEDGRTPVGYSAYERAYCGWLDIEELTTPSSVVLPYIGDNEKAYQVKANDKQYFTFETRLQQGWDVGLPSEGMMIVKIDYDATAWNNNTVNVNSRRPRIQIVPADNSLSSRSLEGDLYPYAGNNVFTSTSTPAMKIYNTTIDDKPVENITYDAENGVVTFDFMGGAPNTTLAAPVATSAGGINNEGFTAYWSPVSGASSYTLHLQGDNFEQEYKYIMSTRYTLTGLMAGTYYYKVKAVNGEYESSYSNEIEVEIPGLGAVSSMQVSDVRAYVTGDGIVIESDKPYDAMIYNAQGMLEAVVNVDRYTTYRPRLTGLYIVVCGETSYKLIVR